MPKQICPACKSEFAASHPPPPEFPFCSPRCKMVDLGRWFTGQYSIARPVTDEDLSSLPGAASPADMIQE